MSISKYAGLPDIDTAPDVYETEDTVSNWNGNEEAAEEESGAGARSTGAKGKYGESLREELDFTHLNAEEAGKKFRKAEKRNEQRQRTVYTYPPSPHSPTFPTQTRNLSMRLRTLQAELESLEAELSDPSNPLLHVDHNDQSIDPGSLIRGLVDVRGRLDRLRKDKEGHGRLIEVVMEDGKAKEREREREREKDDETDSGVLISYPRPIEDVKDNSQNTVMADIDKRVGELESIVGSSSATLDESSQLPPPLLPMLTRLNAQLSLLTQPRHLDSISRRLKLLLSDLDRISNSQQQAANRRQTSHPASSTGASASYPGPSPLQEQLAPLISRLSPYLTHIPHILTRLRTLSGLHASASEFQETLQGLEEEQKRARSALQDLETAVQSVESSLTENTNVVKSNVSGLHQRMEALSARVDVLHV